MNRIYESMKMIDENEVEMNASTQSANNRVNHKSVVMNERRVLAPIESKSRNIPNEQRAKRIPNEYSLKNSNVSTVNAVMPAIRAVTEPNIGCKSSDFTIFCDQSDSQSNLKDKGCDSFDAKQSKQPNDDHLIALDSLAIEEQIDENQVIDQEMTCDESLMFDTDDEEEVIEDDSVCERTSEVTRSFDATELSRCKEYAIEVYKYLLCYERKVMADPFYVGKQPEINAKMRSILIDWMVEVTEEYKLLDESLFLAVNYIDRFLSIMSISRSSFQLLGTASLFISTKYEEIYPPDLGEFVYITDDSYTKLQILNMEKLILKALHFDVSTPTIQYFLEKFASDLNLEPICKHLAKYLCYLTLLESEPFLQYYPSEIAICSIILSTHTLDFCEKITQEFIQSSVSYESKQRNGDLKDFMAERQACIEALHKMHYFAHKHPQQAIQQKYASDKCYRVSMIEALRSPPRV